jgi:nucleoid DNA-binding protein
MGKSELYSQFAERFAIKRTQARDFFDELAALAERELKRSGEFELPGLVKLKIQHRQARTGRNPATGEPIAIAPKTVVKARIVTTLKRTVVAGGAVEEAALAGDAFDEYELADSGLEGDPIKPTKPKPGS